MRVLQLSDPHLLADPRGRYRGVEALAQLRHGWRQALTQLAGEPPDLLLLSGDLCQDESWGGYVRLHAFLEQSVAPLGIPIALLPGNHDHLGLLRAALGRSAAIAPALLPLGPWQLLLLSSHRPGAVAGWIEPRQQAWLEAQLQRGFGPVLVALHHPPLPLGGGTFLDALALQQPQRLLAPLLASPRVRGVVFGHIHQHWQGSLERPGGGPPLPLWGCPSTLAQFEAVQPCPLGRPDWPGGRLLGLGVGGEISTRLLRWQPLAAA
jgi:Icc protein